MINVLIVSLGTSPDPIVNCILSLRPDRVVFLCSSETQKLVDLVLARVPLADFKPERDVVVLQQRLSTKQGEEVINELDQLDRVYARSLDLFAAIRLQQPSCSITADYTGGTKTMTTGLAMAAIDDGAVKLNLTISTRTTEPSPASRYNFDLAGALINEIVENGELDKEKQKTLSKLIELLPQLKTLAKNHSNSAITGFSAPVGVSTAAIQARRLQEWELPELLARFEYEAARRAVRRVLDLGDQDPQTSRLLNGLHYRLVALDAWDRFDHRRALEVLERLGDPSLVKTLLFPLKRVVGSRQILDRQAATEKWPSMTGHGLAAVEDLLRNAERRAAQDRYDDAVGRLYRAMELTVQILLKESADIETADVAIQKLPPPLQATYQAKKEAIADGGKLKLALVNAYDLLADLEHPVGIRWREQRSSIENCLKTRNHSLFAHGFSPISYGDWKALLDTLGPFLQQAIDEAIEQAKASPLQQLPCTLAELLMTANS